MTILALTDPITPTSRSQLIDYLLTSAKPRSEWKTGLELELIGYRRHGGARLDTSDLAQLLAAYSDDQILDNGLVVGACGPDAILSLEPGGQLEYSSQPHASLGEAERALKTYLVWLREQAEVRGIIFLGIGFDPLRAIDEQHWILKQRYQIMRPYLQGRGARAWDMMTRTASLQVNLDYDSAEDLTKKFIVANRLAPIASAIFANSPFREGQFLGYKSERCAAWLETDPDRCGIAPPAIAEQLSLDQFLDYVLSVPMFFIRRDDQYFDMKGLSFGDFLRQQQPILQDFADHLTTIFTEARIKQWLEVRCADSGGIKESLAVQAFWKGLLYCPDALDEALRIALRLDARGFRQLQECVARGALAAKYEGINVGYLARTAVELAQYGLRQLAPDEVVYLETIIERVVYEGICLADILIRNYEGSWHKQMRYVVEYLRVA